MGPAKKGVGCGQEQDRRIMVLGMTVQGLTLKPFGRCLESNGKSQQDKQNHWAHPYTNSSLRPAFGFFADLAAGIPSHVEGGKTGFLQYR